MADPRTPAPAAVSVDAEVAERAVHLTIDVMAGRVLAVLGANGSGKSTLLGLLSGLVRPSAGTVELGGRTVVDVGARVDVPPHRRDVGLLAQDPLLFPHLSVLENVAFGPRSHGARPGEARRIARERLTDVGALEFAGRMPEELSGGQQQRVALARALATAPRLLLLDEPLAALDVDVAARIRRLLARTLRDGERTVVLVTHDLLDVVALADDVVALDAGRVVESGPALELLRHPRTPFLARLAGLVLVPGVLGAFAARAGGADPTLDDDASVDAAGIDGIDTPATVRADGLTLTGRLHEELAPGVPVVAAFRPASVALYPPDAAPAGSPRNAFALTVTALEPLGGMVRVRSVVTPPDAYDHGSELPLEIAADVTPGAVAELGLVVGARVAASVKAAEVDVYARADAPAGHTGPAGPSRP